MVRGLRFERIVRCERLKLKHKDLVSTVLRHVDHVDVIVTDQLDLVTVEQADDLFYPASNVLGKTFVIYRLANVIACVEDVSTDSMHFNQLIFRQVLAGDRIMLNDAVRSEEHPSELQSLMRN